MWHTYTHWPLRIQYLFLHVVIMFVGIIWKPSPSLTELAEMRALQCQWTQNLNKSDPDTARTKSSQIGRWGKCDADKRCCAAGLRHPLAAACVAVRRCLSPGSSSTLQCWPCSRAVNGLRRGLEFSVYPTDWRFPLRHAICFCCSFFGGVYTFSVASLIPNHSCLYYFFRILCLVKIFFCCSHRYRYVYDRFLILESQQRGLKVCSFACFSFFCF